MGMLILGIYGSPRKAGNTDFMLDAFLEGASAAGAQTERIYVRDLQIGGCMACGACDKTGSCVQKDEMSRVYPLMEAASHIVVSSPIYFYGVTGQLKLLIDRSQAVYMKRELAKKNLQSAAPASEPRKGFLLSAGATRGKRLFECAVLSVQYFFEALSVEYVGDLCFRQLEERDAIRSHPTALDECKKAGSAFILG
jgi:multimeric flavodoxin WrbA